MKVRFGDEETSPSPPEGTAASDLFSPQPFGTKASSHLPRNSPGTSLELQKRSSNNTTKWKSTPYPKAVRRSFSSARSSLSSTSLFAEDNDMEFDVPNPLINNSMDESSRNHRNGSLGPGSDVHTAEYFADESTNGTAGPSTIVSDDQKRVKNLVEDYNISLLSTSSTGEPGGRIFTFGNTSEASTLEMGASDQRPRPRFGAYSESRTERAMGGKQFSFGLPQSFGNSMTSESQSHLLPTTPSSMGSRMKGYVRERTPYPPKRRQSSPMSPKNPADGFSPFRFSCSVKPAEEARRPARTLARDGKPAKQMNNSTGFSFDTAPPSLSGGSGRPSRPQFPTGETKESTTVFSSRAVSTNATTGLKTSTDRLRMTTPSFGASAHESSTFHSPTSPPSSGGLFGSTAKPLFGSSDVPLFGSTPVPTFGGGKAFEQPAPTPRLFCSEPAPAFGASPAPSTGSLFGTTTTPTAAPSPGTTSLFGGSTTTSPAPATSSLCGGIPSPEPGTSTIFGGDRAFGTPAFGAPQFGSSADPYGGGTAAPAFSMTTTIGKTPAPSADFMTANIGNTPPPPPDFGFTTSRQQTGLFGVTEVPSTGVYGQPGTVRELSPARSAGLFGNLAPSPSRTAQSSSHSEEQSNVKPSATSTKSPSGEQSQKIDLQQTQFYPTASPRIARSSSRSEEESVVNPPAKPTKSSSEEPFNNESFAPSKLKPTSDDNLSGSLTQKEGNEDNDISVESPQPQPIEKTKESDPPETKQILSDEKAQVTESTSKKKDPATNPEENKTHVSSPPESLEAKCANQAAMIKERDHTIQEQDDLILQLRSQLAALRTKESTRPVEPENEALMSPPPPQDEDEKPAATRLHDSNGEKNSDDSAEPNRDAVSPSTKENEKMAANISETKSSATPAPVLSSKKDVSDTMKDDASQIMQTPRRSTRINKTVQQDRSDPIASRLRSSKKKRRESNT